MPCVECKPGESNEGALGLSLTAGCSKGVGLKVGMLVSLVACVVGVVLLWAAGLVTADSSSEISLPLVRAGGLLLGVGGMGVVLCSTRLVRNCGGERQSLIRELGTALAGWPSTKGHDESRGDLELLLGDVQELTKQQAVRERRLRTIIDTEPECVKMVSREGILLDMNPAGLRLIGAESLEEACGLSVFDLVVPEDRARFIEMHERVMSGQSATMVFRIKGLTGVLRWMETHAVPLLDEKGDVESHLAITRDISLMLERKEALVAAMAQAESANIAKSEFLTNMSHELRTPLTSILGYAELLGDESLGPESRRECLQILERNSRHLLQLIDDVLDLSKVESGRVQVSRSAVSVRAVLEDVGVMMRDRRSEKGIEYRTRVAEDVPELTYSDELRVRQIMVNLVGNAFKYTLSGVVETEVTYDGVAGEIRLAVRDTGIGIPKESLESVFEPFGQVDNSTTRRFGGTGLGLNISRQLAELLGGRIEAESRDGSGSVFTLCVPHVEISKEPLGTRRAGSNAPAPGETLERGNGSQPLRGVRVCLAEDGEDNRLLLEYILKGSGASLVMVKDGKEALDLLLEDLAAGPTVDLVLMDMQMPVMSGEDATRLLRDGGWDRPIIALTAHASDEWRERCLATGATDYLTKPFTQDELISVIEKWKGCTQGV